MHICHVNLASGFSGGERQTLQIIKQQIKLGYQLTVVANPKSPFVNEIKKLPCKLVVVSHFLMRHKKNITTNCQLIHVHEGRAIYWAWLQSTLFNIPYLVTRRIDNPLSGKFLSKKAYGKASALVGLSNAITDAIKNRYPFARIYKIPSSPVVYTVDREKVEEIKNTFNHQFILIQAANLLKHKGHQTTIKAASLLESTYPNIHFVLIGDGPQRDVLEKQSTSLANVTLVGKKTDMGNWFAAADLLVHPSDSEGLGSVILEAIQAGLPVIGSKAGGIPDIIEDDVSGLLVEPGNAQHLANAIVAVAFDAQLRNKLIVGGKEKLKLFDIVYTCSLYETIYNKILLANTSP